MLVGISGTICSGKQEIIRYLTYQGFHYISLKDEQSTFEKLGVTPRIKDSFKGDEEEQNTLIPEHVFDTVEELDLYVTQNWNLNIAVCPLNSPEVVEKLAIRPFFLHLICDASSKVRYDKFNSKYGPYCNSEMNRSTSTLVNNSDNESTSNESVISFEKFVEMSEENFLLSSFHNSLIPTVKIINNSTGIKNLYIQLSNLNIMDPLRLRPNWDTYFMKLANLAALRSNCMKRRVGCVIVKENRVIATGYNGTPKHLKNCNEGGCQRCNSNNKQLFNCLCLHAEENALLESGRDRVNNGSSLEKSRSILYCNTCPCLTCSIKIIQCGISEVVYSQSYSMDNQSKSILNEAGIIIRQFSPPKDIVST